MSSYITSACITSHYDLIIPHHVISYRAAPYHGPHRVIRTRWFASFFAPLSLPAPASPRLKMTASRRGRDKRGRRRSAAFHHNQLAWGNLSKIMAPCGKIWRDVATCALLKQTMATCQGFVALLRTSRLPRPCLEASGRPPRRRRRTFGTQAGLGRREEGLRKLVPH